MYKYNTKHVAVLYYVSSAECGKLNLALFEPLYALFICFKTTVTMRRLIRSSVAGSALYKEAVTER